MLDMRQRSGVAALEARLVRAFLFIEASVLENVLSKIGKTVDPRCNKPFFAEYLLTVSWGIHRIRTLFRGAPGGRRFFQEMYCAKPAYSYPSEGV